MPYSEKALKNDIREEFNLLAGYYPEEGKRYFVKSFATIYKGMSTGFLSGDFWIKQAIPLLIEGIEIANSSIK